MVSAIEQLLEYSLQQASRIDRAASQTAKYIEIADTYLKYRNNPRCLEILAAAQRKIDAVKQPVEKAKLLAWLARILTEAGDEIKGKEDFTRAALLARAAETPSQRFEALYRLACEYAEANLKEEAARVLSDLFEIVSHPQDGFDSVQELIDIAEIYADVEQNAKAAEILAEALRLIPELKDIWFKVERLSEIAGTYAGAGFPERALQVLENTLSAVNQTEEANRPYFLLKIAEIFIMLGKKPEAAEVLQSIPDMVVKDELAYSRSRGLIEVAGLYAQLGETSESVKISLQALDIAESIEDTKDKIANFMEIGGILGAAGQREKALAVADQALGLCLRLEDKKSRVYLLGNLARLYIELKNRSQSSAAVSEIIRIVRENRTSTAGLAAIAVDLAEVKEYALALELTWIIREPEVRCSALTGLAQSLVEAEQEPAEETARLIQEIITPE